MEEYKLTKEELVDLLEYLKYEDNQIFMPNEIFTDFPELIEGGSSKISFA